jgi:succinyl-CoA synthetase alpha subunit
MVDHPAKFGGVMKDILAKSGRSVKKIVGLLSLQQALQILTSNRSSQQPKHSSAAHTTHHGLHAVHSQTSLHPRHSSKSALSTSQ